MKKWVAALAIPVISGLIILFVTKALENLLNPWQYSRVSGSNLFWQVRTTLP